MNRISALCLLFLLSLIALPVQSQRVRAAGVRPPKRAIASIRIEKTVFNEQGGKLVESPRQRLAEITFDATGFVTESKIFFPKNDLLVRYAAKRDAGGKKIEDAYFGGNGKQIDKRTYSYDANGRVTEILSYGEKKEPVLKIAIRRDAAGRAVERIEEDLKEKTTERATYAYRDAERTVEVRAFDEKNIPQSVETYILNLNGDLVGYQQRHRLDPKDRSGNLFQGFTQEKSYGDEGTVTEESLTYGDILGGEHSVYEFDPEGNWTSRRIERLSQTSAGTGFVPFEATYRTIAYRAENVELAPPADPLGNYVDSLILRFVHRGSARERPFPGYPTRAKQTKVMGDILVPVKISDSGRILFTFGTPVQPGRQRFLDFQPLVESARFTAFKWKFEPSLADGEPTEVLASITFSFQTS
jgi:hypothetical protein